jgi:hypothetical protein
MKLREVKEQLQEDILSILEGFRADEDMDKGDYEDFKNALCKAVIINLDKITEL